MSKKSVKFFVSAALLVAAAGLIAFSFFKKGGKIADGLNQLVQTEIQQSDLISENQAEESPAIQIDVEPETQPSAVSDSMVTDGKKDTDVQSPKPSAAIDEGGWYYSKNDVALYIHTYGKLPKNFIKKSEAEKLGWGNGTALFEMADGMCIGGDRFYNREGVLPQKSGRTYTECDIDTKNKKSRGKKRIVFSNDGLIYYTADHYESFDLLYGEE